MQPDSDGAVVEFESLIEFDVPRTGPRQFGLNPDSAGYRKRATCCKWLFYVASGAVAIVGGALWFANVIPLHVGAAMVHVPILAIVGVAWSWHGTEFCESCGALTKSPMAGGRAVWCPGCQRLNDPQQMLIGVRGGWDLEGPAYLCHDDPVVKFVSMCTLLAICDDAREIRFEPGADTYDVTIVTGGEAFELQPAPGFIRLQVPQVVKVIAGLDRSVTTKSQEGCIDIRVHGEIVSAHVLVEPAEHGERAVFRW